MTLEQAPDTTDILRIAAFADGDTGGNPAGVWIGPALPPADVRGLPAWRGIAELIKGYTMLRNSRFSNV